MQTASGNAPKYPSALKAYSIIARWELHLIEDYFLTLFLLLLSECCTLLIQLREEGVLGLWRGVGPNIGRNAIINAAELASYDQVISSVYGLGIPRAVQVYIAPLVFGVGEGSPVGKWSFQG